MRIIEIKNTAPNFIDFIELPYKIRKKSERWVPPLIISERYELSPSNLFFTHGEAAFFLCVDQTDKIIGRISASYDYHSEEDNNSNKIGSFGHFECINNQKAANLLLNTVEQWLASKKIKTLAGPMNFSIFKSYRVQTMGFNTEPFLGEPRNPAYFHTLFLDFGLKDFMEWRSWDLNTYMVKAIKDHIDSKLKNEDENQFTLKTIDTENYQQEIQKITATALNIFSENYGYAPITTPEFLQIFMPLESIIEKESFIVAYDQNEIIGFVYGYNDPAKDFIDAYGNHENLINTITENPSQIIYHTFGIKKDYRNTKVVYALSQAISNFGVKKGIKVIGALAKEGTTAYDKTGSATRKYSIMKKIIKQN